MKASASKPSLLGAQRTFGFGDRLGFAAGPSVKAARGSGFAPVFAQQSAAELSSTGRLAVDVLLAATEATRDFPAPWGTDADGITTLAQAESFARAGFSRMTVDPSAYFVERAAELFGPDLEDAAAALVEDDAMPAGWVDLYLGHEFPISEGLSLRFTPDDLLRVAVKFGWAIAFASELSAAFTAERGSLPYEMELSLVRTDRRTTAHEHLFVALECRRRALPLVAIAPRLPGWWEPDAEYEGDLSELERELTTHAAIATSLGPYQISIPEIEGKLGALPAIARACGQRLHVKTSAASVLEAMRVVIRQEPALFRKILSLAQERFPFVRAEKPISLTEDEVRCLPEVSNDQLESMFLEDPRGRQLLDVTIGSLWADGTQDIRARLSTLLLTHSDLYSEFVASHLGSLITGLKPG